MRYAVEYFDGRNIQNLSVDREQLSELYKRVDQMDSTMGAKDQRREEEEAIPDLEYSHDDHDEVAYIALDRIFN